MKYYALINNDGYVIGIHGTENTVFDGNFPPELGVSAGIEIESEDAYPAGKVYKNGQFVDPPEMLTSDQKAGRVMFRVLAKTDVISQQDALDNQQMFERWIDRIDTQVTTGEYLQYEDGLYRVQQTHTVLEIYPPSTATAALYTRINHPDVIPEWTQGSWDAGVKVRHNGKIWESMVPNNVWEPGAVGVGENIWKEVAV